MEQKNIKLYLLIIFSAALTLFALLSYKFGFHDTPEYIYLIRTLAGYGNASAFSSHSFVYSLMAVPFVWAWQSVKSIMLFNILWLILTAALLAFAYKSSKTLLLWIFCPLVWIVSLQTTPILPATFFILCAYACFIKWETSQKKIFFIISALSMGLSFVVYAPVLIIMALFLIFFFYRKPFSNFAWFLLLLSLPVLISIIIDYILTGIPGYSYITYFGTNLMVILGKNAGTPFFQGLVTNHEYIYLIVLVSPLIFLIYKTAYAHYRREVWLLGLTVLFFIIRGGLMKYFLPIVPFAIILLGLILTKKQVMISAVLSLVLISIFTFSYFGETREKMIDRDMAKIESDYNLDYAMAIPDVYLNYWGNTQFYWPEEYFMKKNNEIYFSAYKMESHPRIMLYKQLELQANLRMFEGRDMPASMKIIGFTGQSFEGFYPEKCYSLLCIYSMDK